MASEDESMIIMGGSLVAGRFGSGAATESLHRMMIRKKEEETNREWCGLLKP